MLKIVVAYYVIVGIFPASSRDYDLSCGHPGYVRNGRLIGNLFTFPNKVEYECDDGFKLGGKKDRYCKANKEWSGRLPTCERINCSVPSDPVNGRVLYPCLEYGVQLGYVCNEGFVLKNYKPRVCTKDGTWSNNEPECKSGCYLKNLQKSAHVDTALSPSTTESGESLNVTCKEGYFSPRSERPICLNGNWTNNSGSPCKENDCTIPHLHHGDMRELKPDWKFNWWTLLYERKVKSVKIPTGKVVLHGTSLVLFCDTSYSFHGRGEEKKLMRCYKGRWKPDPVCLRSLSGCSKIARPPDSVLIIRPEKNDYKLGDNVIFSCPPGMRLNTESERIMCLTNGWSETIVPECK